MAVHKSTDSVFINWPMLGTKQQNIGFNLYRKTGNAAAIKLTPKTITESTSYGDSKVDFTQPILIL